MALSKIDVANMLTGATPVANGGTALTSGFVNGYTGMADQWSLTTSFTDSAEPIASNWEQNDEASFDPLGSSMTQSSGIFTFPSTGFYLVTFNAGTEANNLTADMFDAVIQVTINNSDYDSGSIGQMSQTNISSGHGQSTSISQVVDVTNTTNVKVRFQISNASSNVYTQGSTSVRKTFATFLRLGDT
jgi:hypothetical protein